MFDERLVYEKRLESMQRSGNEATLATLADLLAECSLRELEDGLTALSLESLAGQHDSSGRTGVLNLLKEKGVAKLSHRQAITNAFGKAKREGRLQVTSSSTTDSESSNESSVLSAEKLVRRVASSPTRLSDRENAALWQHVAAVLREGSDGWKTLAEALLACCIASPANIDATDALFCLCQVGASGLNGGLSFAGRKVKNGGVVVLMLGFNSADESMLQPWTRLYEETWSDWRVVAVTGLSGLLATFGAGGGSAATVANEAFEVVRRAIDDAGALVVHTQSGTGLFAWNSIVGRLANVQPELLGRVRAVVHENPGLRPDTFSPTVAQAVCSEVLHTGLQRGHVTPLNTASLNLIPAVEAYCDMRFTPQLRSCAEPSSHRSVAERVPPCPVLCIAGVHDRTSPPQAVEAFAQLIRDAQPDAPTVIEACCQTAPRIQVALLPGGHLGQLKNSPVAFGEALDGAFDLASLILRGNIAHA